MKFNKVFAFCAKNLAPAKFIQNSFSYTCILVRFYLHLDHWMNRTKIRHPWMIPLRFSYFFFRTFNRVRKWLLQEVYIIHREEDKGREAKRREEKGRSRWIQLKIKSLPNLDSACLLSGNPILSAGWAGLLVSFSISWFFHLSSAWWYWVSFFIHSLILGCVFSSYLILPPQELFICFFFMIFVFFNSVLLGLYAAVKPIWGNCKMAVAGGMIWIMVWFGCFMNAWGICNYCLLVG